MRCESSGFFSNGVKRYLAAIAALVMLGTASAAFAEAWPVYRFYNTQKGTHFYTISAQERDSVLALYPWFAYEGVAFWANRAQEADSLPVYRFYNNRTGTHFYTMSESEKNFVIANYPVFIFEGAAYYAPPADAVGNLALFRFYNTRTGAHFYTTSAEERDAVLRQWPWFAFEGTSYYVYQNATPPGGGGNVAPKIDLTVSATTVGVPGAVMVSANATDADGTVAKVQFFVNGAMLTEMTSPPYAYAYTANAAGMFTFTATAIDDKGASTTSSPVVVTATSGGGGGNIAPKATLTTSVTTVTVPGTVAMNVVATDDDGTVAKVQFYSNGTLLGEDTTAPFSYSYNITTAGTYALSAIATDNLGATGASNIVTIAATNNTPPGNVAPRVTLTSNPNPPTVQPNTPVVFTANATDQDGTISKVEFYNGTSLVTTRTTAPYTYTFTPTVVGTSSWTAVAYDNLNATGTSNAITVNVNNTVPPPATAPRVALSLNNTLVTSVPTTLTLTATATVQVTGNTITRVGFFQNGAKLVDDTTSPYTTTVTITTPGTYTFHADASDNQGNVGSTLLQTVVAKTTPPPVVTTDADIWRLLNQATFGASQAEAAQVIAKGGITAWVDDQLAKPMTTGFPTSKYNRLQLGTTADCTTNNVPANSPQAECARDHLTLAMIQRDFFTQAVYAPDQLRARVAWALHQIVVTSGAEPDLAYAYVMARYQQIFFDEAFGNYRNILMKASLSPAMGNYLDSVNNDKPSPGRVPNENYAREIMQLFSIGLEELNTNGTPLLDALGNPIPTYTQADIAEVARVFTGWTFPRATGTTTGKNPRYYDGDMVPYPSTATTGHDTGAKVVLSGVTIPANQTIQKDLSDMVDNVFLHPNTPVYIGKQLIQRLVTGNPNPAYVQRIAAVFANNGAGVRGDLRAVVRAILLDPEARGGPKSDPLFGSLKEPVLMLTSLIRALDGITDGAGLEGRGNTLGQRPYFAPTVFNYFPPDQTIPGTAILAPEMGIHNTNTAVSRTNTVYSLIYANGIGVDQNLSGAMGTRLNLGQFEALADNPNALVAKVNDVLMGGQFPATSLPTVEAAVAVIPISTTSMQYRTDRTRMAVYLMASSFHFQVQR